MEPGGAAEAPGLEGRVPPASALTASSAEGREAPRCPGVRVLGQGCGLWRRLGREPHYFKPLVPMQLPSPLSVQAAATRAEHTGTPMADTCAQAHGSPRRVSTAWGSSAQPRRPGSCTWLPVVLGWGLGEGGGH